MECIQEKSVLGKKVRSAYRRNSHYEEKMAITDTLHSVASRYGKTYSYPSQETILRLLKQWHGIVISLRTLNRRLAEMVQEKSLRRIRRLKTGKTGKLEFWTTLYHILQYPVAAVKRFLRTCTRVAGYFPSANISRQSFTTKKDIQKDSANERWEVPPEWFSTFRRQLQAG